jgi:hypothetical protein
LGGKLHSVLAAQRAALIERWFERILATYPPETARFLRNEPDRFANPLGGALRGALPALVDGLLQGEGALGSDAVRAAMDSIVRIRAVQELTPSQAVAVVFALKGAIDDVLGGEAEQLAGERLEYASRVDALALIAFEIYVSCKEKMYEIRVHEMKNRTFKLVERMNRIYGKPEEQE